MSLRLAGPRVVAAVEDRGAGFDAAAQPGPCSAADDTRFGLISIRERVAYYGGTFDVQSKPGGGTRVTIEVPPRPEGR